MKQVIIMRKDLDMSTGKAIAQGAHASVKAVMEGLTNPTKAYDFQIDYQEWKRTGSTKIVLGAKNFSELSKIEDAVNEANIVNSGIIMDEGRTEFGHQVTPTCLAIGPATNEDIDKITKRLRLF